MQPCWPSCLRRPEIQQYDESKIRKQRTAGFSLWIQSVPKYSLILKQGCWDWGGSSWDGLGRLTPLISETELHGVGINREKNLGRLRLRAPVATSVVRERTLPSKRDRKKWRVSLNKKRPEGARGKDRLRLPLDSPLHPHLSSASLTSTNMLTGSLENVAQKGLRLA